MHNLSLRGVDASTLSRIQTSARRRKISVNRVIIETLQQQFGAARPANDTLLRLAGKWSAAEADAFDAAVAPFGEVDAGMWVAEPVTPYLVTPIATPAAPPKRKSNVSSAKRVKPAPSLKGKKATRK